MIRSSKKNGLHVEVANKDLSLDQLIASIDQLNQNITKLRLARSQRSPTSMALSFGTFSPNKTLPKLTFSEFEPSIKVQQKNDAHSPQPKKSRNPCASPIYENNVHLLSPKKLTTSPKQKKSNNLIYASIGPAHR